MRCSGEERFPDIDHAEASKRAIKAGFDGVEITSLMGYLKKGNEVLLPADTVIAAGPRKSRQDLVHQVEFMVDETHIIGDAIAPRGLHNAIHEGYKLGCRV